MKNEVKVGVAVLISLIILVGGIMWGKGFRLQAQRYNISVLFTNTGGLESGANVLANGVVKGRVKSIIFEEGFVRVNASLDDDVQIFSDYMITIESPTVMAGSVLSVYTGSEPPHVEVLEELKGTDPQGVSAVVARIQTFTERIEVTLSNLDSLLINMNKVVGDTSNRANLAKLTEHAARTAQTTDELLTANRETIEAALRELQGTLASTRELTEKLNQRSDTTLAAVDSAMAALTSVAHEVRDLMARLNAGEGTVGKLMTDDALYQRLTSTLAEMDSLSRSLRTGGLRHKIVFF